MNQHTLQIPTTQKYAHVDANLGQNPEPPAEELGNALMIAPQGKIAAKPHKTQQKRKRRGAGTSLD